MVKPIHVVYIASGLLLCCVISMFFVPKSKLSNAEYDVVKNWVYTLNKKCPEMSALGQLENVEFKDNYIVWNLKIFGDEAIEEFYTSNADVLRLNYEYYFYILYATNQLIRDLLEKDINFMYRINLPSGQVTEEIFNLTNINPIIDNTNFTTQRALYNILKTDLNLYTYNGIYTPVVVALEAMFPPDEATPYEVNIYDNNIVVIDWDICNDNLFSFLEAYILDDNPSERLEKVVGNLRKQSEEIRFLTDLCYQANAEIYFKFHKGSEIVILPIPCTKNQIIY